MTAYRDAPCQKTPFTGRPVKTLSAIPAAFSFIFCCFLPSYASYSSETRYRESLDRLNEGKLQQAMIGFMDVLIDDPENQGARDNLREIGAKLLEKEKNATDAEREDLFSDSEKIRGELLAIQSEKRLRQENWENLADRVASLASDPEKIKQAVNAYEALLQNTPVYSDGLDKFNSETGRIKENMFDSIKKKYPLWTGDKESLNPKDLATAVFLQESAEDVSHRYIRTETSQEILKMVEDLNKYENRLKSIFLNSGKALELHSMQRYSQSIPLWEQVKKEDPKNPEAVFYLKVAKEHLSKPAGAKIPVVSGVRAPMKQDPRLSRPLIPDATGMKREKEPEFSDRRQTRLAVKKRSSQARKIKLRRKITARAAPAAASPGTGDYNADEAGGQTDAPADNSSANPAPDSRAEELYQKGVKEYAMGNLAKAAGYWKQCVETDPDHPRAKKALDRVMRELK